MTTFFISYRTEDEGFGAVVVHGRLIGRFGGDAVCRDIGSAPRDIAPESWHTRARDSLLVVVIGPHWVTGPAGVNHLADPDDYVRRQIALALRIGRPIRPVLVGGAPIPAGHELPDDIRPLGSMQYRRIGVGSVEADIDRLVGDLAEEFGEPAAPALASVVLVDGLQVEAVRDAAGDAGLPAATITDFGSVVRLDQPGTEPAAVIGGDFLRALATRADGPPGRVALLRDEPVSPRLLDEPIFGDVMAATAGARMVVLLTDAFYRLAIASGHPSIDKASFARVRLSDGSPAWVHVPGFSAPRGVPPFRPDQPDHADRAGATVANVHFANSGHAAQVNELHGDQIFGDKVMGSKHETHHHRGAAS